MFSTRYENEQQAEEYIQSILTKESEEFDSPAQAKSFIEALLYCRNQSKRNLRTLAQSLDSTIETVLSSRHKYIYELIQNADDACATEVTIDIRDNSLVLSHTGNHFRPKDVEKICDNAQSAGNKSDDIQKTGYKGVGFKANFHISKKITIVSNDVCFRFDQSGFEPATDYPWPIMPLWTEKNEIPYDLHPSQVHFYLENINRQKVESEIDEIFSSPELLLLLRHINKVTLRHKNLEIIRERDAELITLCKIEHGANICQSSYQIHEFPITIPEEQKHYLKELSASECPEKLKNANQVQITFAVAIDENLLPIHAPNARLYSYLPTDIESKLPFWVNAEFLLKQDRGGLLDREWNHFLIYNIAYFQFEVIRRIAEKTMHHSCLLAILPINHIDRADAISSFAEAYRTGFDKGISSIAFIPSMNGPLLRREECIVDEHDFFEHENGGVIASPELFTLFHRYFNEEHHSKIICHKLGSAEIIKRNRVNASKFDQ